MLGLYTPWMRTFKNKGDFNGWFCPCHGSHYDVSGRIRKGPAQQIWKYRSLNLLIAIKLNWINNYE